MPSRAILTAEANRKIRIYVVIGVAILLILLATLATAGREQIFRCDRLSTGEIDCVVKHSILGVITLDSKTTSGVQAISLGQQCVDVNCKYRLEMYATQGLVPVNEKYSSDFVQIQNLKNQINKFFTDNSSSYVQVNEATKPILIVGVVVVGMLILGYLGYLVWMVQHPSMQEGAVRS